MYRFSSKRCTNTRLQCLTITSRSSVLVPAVWSTRFGSFLSSLMTVGISGLHHVLRVPFACCCPFITSPLTVSIFVPYFSTEVAIFIPVTWTKAYKISIAMCCCMCVIVWASCLWLSIVRSDWMMAKHVITSTYYK